MPAKSTLKSFAQATSVCVLLITLIVAGTVASGEVVLSHSQVIPSESSVSQSTAEQTGAESPSGSETQDDTHHIDALPQRNVSYTDWNQDEAPNYWRYAGEAVCDLDIKPGHILYSELDDLGRAGRVAGTISYEMVLEGIARERSDMQSLRPSGWGHNERVEVELFNGGIYRGYFWNRSHLIAKALGGQDILPNLICGTRMQNVGANDGQGGMAYVEGLARRWIETHPTQTLFYSAQPLYAGTELVPRSVYVEILSDDGQLDAAYEIYNCAIGYYIDYAQGSFVRQS